MKIAADIHSVLPHTGNEGWIGYTGTLGWMYPPGIQAIPGISRAGNMPEINPCIPRDRPAYKLTHQFGTTRHLINVENPHGVNQGVQRVVPDGKTLTDNRILLSNEGGQYKVQVPLAKVTKEQVDGN